MAQTVEHSHQAANNTPPQVLSRFDAEPNVVFPQMTNFRDVAEIGSFQQCRGRDGILIGAGFSLCKRVAFSKMRKTHVDSIMKIRLNLNRL